MSLPTVAVTTLVAFNVIPATLGVAIGLGTALLLLVGLGWRIASAIFDRERLITSTTALPDIHVSASRRADLGKSVRRTSARADV